MAESADRVAIAFDPAQIRKAQDRNPFVKISDILVFHDNLLFYLVRLGNHTHCSTGGFLLEAKALDSTGIAGGFIPLKLQEKPPSDHPWEVFFDQLFGFAFRFAS